ncbi:MAG TPA: AAA family ATPase [Chloroflexaceae bacterium]|nr:AAA family ATPase [Chloroflexaceae bacterium]
MAPPYETPLTCPVLIGRSDEQTALAALLMGSRGEQRTVALISGEAGIGKSRLAATAKALALNHGFQLLEGRCFAADAAFPYAPLVDILGRLLAQPAPAATFAQEEPLLHKLAQLLPELALLIPGVTVLLNPLTLDRNHHRRRLLTALRQLISRLTAHQPALLVVEDLHWCDEDSLGALLHLARQSYPQRLSLLGTYRADEVSPPLRAWLAQLERERLALELPLSRLSRDDIQAMIQAIFRASRPPPAALVRAIAAGTEGVPFYVEELASALATAGELAYVDGAWQRIPLPPEPDGRVLVPRSVEAIVHQRAAQLSAPAHALLQVASVAGRSFDASLLQRVLGCDEAQLLALLKELLAAQLIVEETADRFAFRHVLTQQAVAQTLLLRERQAWHRRLAEVLEALIDTLAMGERQLVALASHCYAGALWDKALKYGRRAGAAALARHAPAAAVEHLSRALEAAAHLGSEPTADVLLARGQAYRALGEFEPARDDCERSLALALAADDGVTACQAMLVLGELWAERDYAQAGAWFRRASEQTALLDDPSLQAHSLNRLGNWLVNTGRAEEGLLAHHQALRLFEGQGHALGVAESHDLLGTAYGMLGERVQAVVQLGQAVEHFRATDATSRLISSLTMRALQAMPGACETTLSPLWPRDACVGDATEALELARQIEALPAAAFAENALAHTLLAFGELGPALAHARESQRMAVGLSHQQWMIAAAYAVGHSYAQMLAWAPAIEVLAETLASARRLGSQFWAATLAAALGRAQLAVGDLSAAETTLQPFLPKEQHPRTMGERAVTLAWGELALAQGKPDEALRLAELLLASVPGAALGQPLQAIPHLLKLSGEALMALGQVEEATAALAEALRGARERHARPVLWAIHGSLGQAYLLLRRVDAAREQCAAARALIAELGATIADHELAEQFERAALATFPVLPALRPREAARRALGGLTAREYEVALLVAQGRTSREIAGLLRVSERTVEVHVSNVLGKLGFSSRTQIAVWVVERSREGE